MRNATFSAIVIFSAIGFGFAAVAHDDDEPDHHPKHRHHADAILTFDTMYGVDGPFVGNANPIRGVPGDESPWEVARASGALDTEGHLLILVRGLVFKSNPDPALIGKNDEAEFRGLVSCLTEQGNSVVEVNVVTAGFPATESGDSRIHARVALPNPCVAPIIMVLAGSEDKWFSVTGFESEEESEEGD